MLSIETENRVAKLFVNLADREREVELNRQILAQNLDFDAYQAFTVLDKEGKNGIDAVNIVDFLRRNGVYANLTETNFIIQFYDENNDNQLSYTEFLNLVLSENNFALRRLARERVGSSYPRANLPFNVEYSIVKLFEKELELVRSTLSLLDDAKMRFDFNVHNYTQELLQKANHREDIYDQKTTFVTLNGYTRGTGTGSCGPVTLPKYKIDASKEHTFNFIISPSKKEVKE